MFGFRYQTVVALVAGGAGTAAAWTLARMPPGVLRGRAVAILGEVVPGALAVGIVATLALALVFILAARMWREGVDGMTAAIALEPVAWGAAIPLLALILDPFSSYSTAAALTAAGIGGGLIVAGSRMRRLPPARPWSDAAACTMLAVAAVALPTAMIAPGPPWWHPLSGDEPHYLVAARSLWLDGGLDLGDDFEQRRHRQFFPADLSPHAMPGADGSSLYSIHGTGLAVWLAPWQALGADLGVDGFTLLVRFSMTLWLGVFALASFVSLRALHGPAAARWGTAVALFTPPLLFAAPHVFPEVPALALSAASYALLRRRPNAVGAAVAGSLAAALPWLGYKYTGLAVALGAVGIWRLASDAATTHRPRRAVALLAPMVISAAGHVAFTWTLYGSVSPTAITTGAALTRRAAVFGESGTLAIDLVATVRAAIGYFLDQREGLLVYAPHYLLAVAGLAWLRRHRRAEFLELLFALVALWGPYALTQSIGGWSPPARPLTAVVWTLTIPVGIALVLPAGRGRPGRWRSALRGSLLAASAGITLLLIVQSDLLYHDFGTAHSLLLQRYGAPGLPLWRWAPLWLPSAVPQWTVSLGWLAVTLVIGTLLWQWGDNVAGSPPPNLTSRSLSDTPAPTDTHTDPSQRVGLVAAGVVIAAGAAAIVAHNLFVPVTGLHRPFDYGQLRVWRPVSPPQRAWPERRGIWIGGADTADLLVSSRRPLSSVTFEVQSMTAMGPEIQLGRDRARLRLAAGESTYARLRPGPAAPWRGQLFYPFRIVAPGGISPAALGADPEDDRNLGVFVSIVAVE